MEKIEKEFSVTVNGNGWPSSVSLSLVMVFSRVWKRVEEGYFGEIAKIYDENDEDISREFVQL